MFVSLGTYISSPNKFTILTLNEMLLQERGVRSLKQWPNSWNMCIIKRKHWDLLHCICTGNDTHSYNDVDRYKSIQNWLYNVFILCLDIKIKVKSHVKEAYCSLNLSFMSIEFITSLNRICLSSTQFDHDIVVDIQTIKAGNGYVNVLLSKNSSPSNSATAADLIGLGKPGLLMKQTVVLEDNVRNIPFQ